MRPSLGRVERRVSNYLAGHPSAQDKEIRQATGASSSMVSATRRFLKRVGAVKLTPQKALTGSPTEVFLPEDLPLIKEINTLLVARYEISKQLEALCESGDKPFCTLIREKRQGMV